MKKRIPTFLAGMLTATLVGALGVGAIAATNSLSITVDPINIQVNGVTFAPKDTAGKDVPVFAYNGTTYAPVRALAESYGLKVAYDGKAGMVTVDGATANLNANDVYINGTQISATSAIINGATFIPVSTLQDAFGYQVIEKDGSVKIQTEPQALSTIRTDKNGNRIVSAVPSNLSTGNFFMWEYLDIVFSSDTAKGDIGSKITLVNIDDGTKVRVVTQPGSTAPDNFIISPSQALKLGATYSLYIPSGSVKLTNGTTYDEDIRLLFKMTDTAVKGKVSGPALNIGTPIALVSDSGEKIESFLRGGNEFFFANVIAGKYQIELDGKLLNSITVVEGKVNQVTVVPEK